MWLGREDILHVTTWFTVEDFVEIVGRLPCEACREANDSYEEAILCDYDIDSWFDAALAGGHDGVVFCDAH
jgi:hypothetical protein